MKWKHAFKKSRELGPLCLTGVEVELLISAFAPSQFDAGVVDYLAFCKFIDPPNDVYHAMEHIRQFVGKVST